VDKNKPLVSVVIPTYNRPDLLKKAIQTVLDQTFKNLEIIVVDDGSSVGYQEIIDQFDDSSVTYVKNKRRKGGAYSRSLGIKKARGTYIAFLDDDDEWMPQKLEKQLRAFDNQSVGLVVCYSLDKRFGRERISKPPETIDFNYLLRAFTLSSTSSYLFRKKALDSVGYFDSSLPSAQEFELALRLSKHYMIKTIPEILMIQNETEGQISENWNKKIIGIMSIYKKYGHEFKRLGMKNRIKSHFKVLGMIGLFFLGYLFGNRIHNIIVPVKETHER
jgi:glycosyltransferase involved in cell wall biosynthesis